LFNGGKTHVSRDKKTLHVYNFEGHRFGIQLSFCFPTPFTEGNAPDNDSLSNSDVAEGLGDIVIKIYQTETTGKTVVWKYSTTEYAGVEVHERSKKAMAHCTT